MTGFLSAKTTTDVVIRRWTVPIDSDDSADSVVVSGSGVTVDDYDLEGDELVLTLSSGTAGTTGTLTVTVTTSQSRTLVETLYIPIIATTAQIADTARDYINFALRKVIGNGIEADADEQTDGLERLNALVAQWRASGADIGCVFPLTADTVIYCPDYAASALRYGLLLDCAPVYGYEPTALEYQNARRGIQLVKHNNLPEIRESAEFL